ncbi:hypothetical protein Dsin_008462 [Dipteronia sinensis]|uniref:Uncharacterized protein n=1 Tax=Dipteronia sinensis TaxID=43782 RepID=A0AAE0EB74_9ROSI|nr:hypothetical protein Dsin_008462 [Dipteronia sinensis]
MCTGHYAWVHTRAVHSAGHAPVHQRKDTSASRAVGVRWWYIEGNVKFSFSEVFNPDLGLGKNRKARPGSKPKCRVVNSAEPLAESAAFGHRRRHSRFRLSIFKSDLNPPGVNGINKLDGHIELASFDAGRLLRNELESPTPLRDHMSVLEQRVVAKGNKKSIIQGDNPGSSTSITSKGKASKAPRTSSIMVLDSSFKVHPPFGAFQGWEQ